MTIRDTFVCCQRFLAVFKVMTVRELGYLGVESLKATRDTIVTYIPSVAYPIQKRILDLTLATLLILILSVPMMLVAILIKVTSKGSILYKQNRIGLNEKVFKIYKFRTMNCAESDEEFKPAVLGDPRINKFGALLRRTSIDELPNLINVIKGEMSLVGPRPHAVMMDREFYDLSQDYRYRYKVKPGVTGLAQIKGFRGGTDSLDKILGRIRYDLEYVHEASIMLDTKILISTIGVVVIEAKGVNS